MTGRLVGSVRHSQRRAAPLRGPRALDNVTGPLAGTRGGTRPRRGGGRTPETSTVRRQQA